MNWTLSARQPRRIRKGRANSLIEPFVWLA
jgi:hypothetical protein